MPLRRIALTASIIALLAVAAVPVDAAPTLQTGTRSSYILSATISFLQTCVPSPSSSFACPMIAVCNSMIETCPMTTNINGTIGWTVTDLSKTASLNVTRDLTISNRDSTRPVIRNTGSFNESIDLATRLVSLFPSIMPQMDQFLQMAQTTSANSLASVNLTSSIPTLESMMPHRQLYTMWWVNGPLKLNETVPVLVLPTNVTQSSNVDLGGSIGTRDAWTLEFNFTRPMLVPDPSASLTPIPGESIEAGFVFNYDKTSDILLSAKAEVHFGFDNEIAIPPSPCDPSATMVCPAASSPTMIMSNFGVSIEASLKLTNTTVDLSQRLSQTVPPQSNGGSDSGVGSGTNGGSGPNNGTNGADSNSNGNGANESTTQPSGATNQTGYARQAFSWPMWIYAVIGILATIIIASAVWISRRRRPNQLRTDNQSSQANKITS